MSIKFIAATLLLALPAAGAEPPLPKLRIEPTAGGSIFYVKNVSSQPLTAFVIELVDYPGSIFGYWHEGITSESIAPDEEKRIQVSNMTVGAVPDYVKVRAAVYADGTTAGIPEKVTQLMARRRFSLESVRDLIQRLEAVRDAKGTREFASAGLRQALEFMLLPPGAGRESQLAINQSAGRTLFSETANYLDKHSVDETIAKLREWEKGLMASKPAI
jgi:hypothetical protein